MQICVARCTFHVFTNNYSKCWSDSKNQFQPDDMFLEHLFLGHSFLRPDGKGRGRAGQGQGVFLGHSSVFFPCHFWNVTGTLLERSWDLPWGVPGTFLECSWGIAGPGRAFLGHSCDFPLAFSLVAFLKCSWGVPGMFLGHSWGFPGTFL